MDCNIYKSNKAWDGLRFKIQDLIDRQVINTVDTYTFSVYAKCDGSPFKNFVYFFDGDKSISKITTPEELKAQYDKVNADNWTQLRVQLKFNTLSAPDSNKFYVGFETTSKYDGYIYLACPKLERGEIASDYTIAPEDIQNNQNDIQQQIATLTLELAKLKAGTNKA